MEQFERFAQTDIFVEDSDIVPIIIKYADFNEQYHNQHNNTSFEEVIKDYEGIHTCAFLNDGISKGNNANNQFLIILEDSGLSIRVMIHKNCRSFFGPLLLTDKTVVPNDPNEFIRHRCNIRFVDRFADEIEIAEKMQWGNRLSELKSIIQTISELKRPLKEIRKEEDQAIWSAYAEGLGALTKAKQELLKISGIGRVHKEKNKINVLDLELSSTTFSQDFQNSISDALLGHISKPRFITNEKEKECTLVYDGYREFSEDELIEFASIAEQSCYRMKTTQPLHLLKGRFVLKSGDSDNEAVISEFDALLNEYDPDYPQKANNQYYFSSDNDAQYANNIIQQRYGSVLRCTPDTSLVVSFTENGQEGLLQKLEGLFDQAKILEQNSLLVIQSERPIDYEKLEQYSLSFDSCCVKLSVSDFDATVPVLSSLTLSKDGFYYGYVYDLSKIAIQPTEWTYSIVDAYKKKGLKTRCRIVEYVYAFKKSVSKDLMKSLARSLDSVPNIRINSAIGCAYCTPTNATDYEEIKCKINAVLPDSVSVLYPIYRPSFTISFLNDDPNYKQVSFERIESLMRDTSCKWYIESDMLLFSMAFDEEETRDKVVSRMQEIASDYVHLFNLSFDNINGTTSIIFREDKDLKLEYEKDLQSHFSRQVVKLIPASSYDDIQAEIDEAIIEEDHDALSRLWERKKEFLSNAEIIGTCFVRLRDKVKIEVNESFIEKLEDGEISINLGDYIQFPLIGEAVQNFRQRDAMDRILRPGQINRSGKEIPSAVNPNLSNFLFDPRYATDTESDIESVKSQIKERQIESDMNERQREAVAKAIEAQDIAFIQGPPGTGKTTVIAEIIWQEVLRNPSCRILLTSQTNTAVDNALERLQGKRGIRPIRIPKFEGEEKMVLEGKRYLLAQLQNWSDNPTEENSDNAVNIWIDKILKEMDSSAKYSLVIERWRRDLQEKDQFVRSTFVETYLRNVNLVAATCSICGSKNFIMVYKQLYGSGGMYFDVVIMDEASKATPLEMAIPMVLGKKIILIGDHKQLPPMIDDDEVKDSLIKIGRMDLVDKLDKIKESQFKRLFEASQKMMPNLVSTLDTQYRMHKQIMNCITHFYKDDIEGGLKCGIESSMDSSDWDNRGSRYHGLDNPPFINPDVHAIWVDVDGKEEKVGNSPYNRAELKAIEKILKTLRESKGYNEYMSHCTRPEDQEIGVITFYGAQVKELQRMYKEGKFGPGKYKIDVVDSFQGMERNIVIISTVRTVKIGFAKEIERINVAFSRAKRLLIVVGDKDFFYKNAHYRASIKAMKVIGINQLS